jgi:hypothetical protein
VRDLIVIGVQTASTPDTASSLFLPLEDGSRAGPRGGAGGAAALGPRNRGAPGQGTCEH